MGLLGCRLSGEGQHSVGDHHQVPARRCACQPAQHGTLVCDTLMSIPGWEVGVGQEPRFDCQPWARCSCMEVTGQQGEHPLPAGQEAEKEL